MGQNLGQNRSTGVDEQAPRVLRAATRFGAPVLCIVAALFAGPPAVHAQTTPASAASAASASSTDTGAATTTTGTGSSSALPAPGVTNQYSVSSAPASAASNSPVAPSAVSGNEQVLTMRLGTSETWDSNVFLLPNSVDPQVRLGTSTKSDQINATYAGLRIDKPYAQQRFYLDMTETAYRHQNFSYLNFDALQYQGAWNWVVGPRISGTLSAARSQTLVNYSNFQNTAERNVVTTDNRLVSVDGWLSGGWHVLAGATQDQVSNSVPFAQQGSYHALGANAGLKYVSRAGNSITLTTQSSRADYLNQPLDPATLSDDGFRRSESDAIVAWALTGKSSVGATVGWMDYRSNHFSQRDFSGAVGQFGYSWRPTGKLSFNLFASRNLVPYADTTSSYVASDTVSVGPSWQLTSNTSVHASFSRTGSDYKNPVFQLVGPARHDTQRSAQLALDWAPLRTLSLSASLQRTQQSSTDAAFEYGDTTAQLSAALAF